MGFFDKLKAAANFITGGGAVVNVFPANDSMDIEEPLRFVVQVSVKDADVSVRKIYLKVKAFEEVIAENVELFREYGDRYERYVDDVRRTYTTYETEVVVAGAQELEANGQYEYEVSVKVPEEIPPTYHGHNAQHIWQVMAGLDMMGNDPDSGWVTIEVDD